MKKRPKPLRKSNINPDDLDGRLYSITQKIYGLSYLLELRADNQDLLPRNEMAMMGIAELIFEQARELDCIRQRVKERG